MNIRQINFRDNAPGVCEIVEAPSGRTFRATTHAVALALLGAQTPDDPDANGSGEIVWTDYLSTHGLAVGTRGKRSYVLGVLPAQARTVNYTGPLERQTDPRALTLQFPPILLGLMREGSGARSFKHGVVFCLTNHSTTNLGITAAANVAVSFPYGNVYQGTGKICWGSVPHVHIQTIKDLEELFFGSDFNGDLYYAGGGRLASLARSTGNRPLPVPSAAINIPGVIRCLNTQS